jgi:putative nucleotidyltransferase with HDIG domain
MDVARIRPPELPSSVMRLWPLLHAAGGRAWLVGGTVRDLLRGQRPRDHDIVTDLRPEQVLQAVPAADGRDVRFGVCHVETVDGTLSITTLRRDGSYRDHRHPEGVEFVTEPELDAARRDFTINALYLEPLRGELLDPCGGRADLDARLLRTIGDPTRRFGEDALRLLRALRFTARCGLQFETATEQAARAAASSLRTLSAERVFGELSAVFTGPGRERGLRLLVELGFAAVLLPEVAAMDGVTQPVEYHPEGDVLTHVAAVLAHVPEGDPVLAWSAVLHDIGKPPTWRQAEDRIRFDGHDQLSARMAEAVLRRLHAGNELREAVVEICRDHIRIAALPSMRPAKAERWLRSPRFRQHLAFHRADCLGCHGDLSIHAFAERALAELGPERPPLVQGADVLALGIPPGPAVGAWLRAVNARIDEAPLPMDRAAALVLLRELVSKQASSADATGPITPAVVDRWRSGHGGDHDRPQTERPGLR